MHKNSIQAKFLGVLKYTTRINMAYFCFSGRFVPLSDQNRKLVEAIKQGKMSILSTMGQVGDFTLPWQRFVTSHVFNLGHILELQEYVKYKYALDEADEKGWFPLHEAVVQPIQQILEVVLDGKRTSNPFDPTEAKIQNLWVAPWLPIR